MNRMKKGRCWNCGAKQSFPVLIEIPCTVCGAHCMFIPRSMRNRTVPS